MISDNAFFSHLCWVFVAIVLMLICSSFTAEMLLQKQDSNCGMRHIGFICLLFVVLAYADDGYVTCGSVIKLRNNHDGWSLIKLSI